jgi:hypothetical protein
MDELKACPFCNKSPIELHGKWTGFVECITDGCPIILRKMTIEQWQSRPIEDALTAENERLKTFVNQLADGEVIYSSAGDKFILDCGEGKTMDIYDVHSAAFEVKLGKSACAALSDKEVK